MLFGNLFFWASCRRCSLQCWRDHHCAPRLRKKHLFLCSSALLLAPILGLRAPVVVCASIAVPLITARAAMLCSLAALPLPQHTSASVSLMERLHWDPVPTCKKICQRIGLQESGNPDTSHNSPKNLLHFSGCTSFPVSSLSAVSTLTAIPMRAVTSPDAWSATHAAFRSAPSNGNSRGNGTDLKSVFLLSCVERKGHHSTPNGTQGILVSRTGHLGHHPGTSPPTPCCNHCLAATRGAGSAGSSFLSFFDEPFCTVSTHAPKREKCRIF